MLVSNQPQPSVTTVHFKGLSLAFLFVEQSTQKLDKGLFSEMYEFETGLFRIYGKTCHTKNQSDESAFPRVHIIMNHDKTKELTNLAGSTRPPM